MQRILVAFAAFVTVAIHLAAQQPAAVPSCCAESADAPLPPLPADATEKEKWLRRIHDEAERETANIFLSTSYIAQWRERLAKLPASASLPERFGVRWSLAQALVRIGALDEAIDLCRQCAQLCDENPATTKPWLPEVLFRLASTHFRQAEKQNCIARHNSDSCILPLSPRAVHVDKQGAQAAVEVLERLLALPDSDLRLESVWLLNIAHMALGSWPDGVPEAHRIPASVFAAEAPMGRMVERGSEIGMGRHAHAGSIAVDDFTGDGLLDVMMCSFDTGRPLRLLRNDGAGGFEDVAEAAGLGRQLGGTNLMQADVDNDGLLDVFVVRGGGFFAGSRYPCSLLRQDRPGHFVDITKDAGLEIGAPARTAAFADIDRDGDLDLFVGYESERGEAGVRFPARLYRNEGGGRFLDITDRSGVGNGDRCTGAVFGDFTGDGLPDLYVSNFLAANKLFVNRGDGTFRDEAAARGVDGPLASGPVVAFDADNDGDLDLFVAWQHHYRQVRSVAAFYVERRIEDDTQRLFVNDGKGNFTDATEARGLRRVAICNGLNVGDIDNDGNQDLYLTTGAHDFAALFPNVLLLNGPRFRDATSAAGVGHLQKGNGVAFADIDGDGDLDLAAQVGGYYQDDGFGSVLFENPGNDNHWLEVRLRGERDNRFGVGARIRVVVADDQGPRDLYATMGSGGSAGCNPLRAHFGLGHGQRIERVDVLWPATGAVQTVTGVDLDQAIEVRQGAAGFTAQPRQRTPIGARK